MNNKNDINNFEEINLNQNMTNEKDKHKFIQDFINLLSMKMIKNPDKNIFDENTILVIDRFEEYIAVCENRETR